MDSQQFLGSGLAELVMHPTGNVDAPERRSRKDSRPRQVMNLRPVAQLSDQANCVGRTAFDVFCALATEGKSAKSIQRCIEYYINKSLDSSYARQAAARTFNQFAQDWKMESTSGRVALTARAFGVDQWHDESARISVRLIVRTKVLDLAS